MLSALEIKHAKAGVKLADGGGLYLQVAPAGTKSWIFRYQLNKKRSEMGLGSLAHLTAPEARTKAANLAAMVRAGIDPLAAKKAEKVQQAESADAVARGEVNFSTVVEQYIRSVQSGWKNAKHAEQWRNTLTKYAYPFIGSKPVNAISKQDVLRILEPIWTTKTETASRVRNRIELVLGYATALEMREGNNPATWRGNLDAILPKPTKLKNVKHRPALSCDDLPAFMAALRQQAGGAARALELAILTAARSQEVRLAEWSEFDLEAKLWAVPKAHMKMRIEHLVPLSDAVVALLKGLPRFDRTTLLFPGVRDQKPLSDMSLSAVVRRMNDPEVKWADKHGVPVVPHGFRSTFRDWAGDRTSYPRDLCEQALAHSIGNKAEEAYRRQSMLDRRRPMMEEWAAVCGGQAAKVTPIKRKTAA